MPNPTPPGIPPSDRDKSSEFPLELTVTFFNSGFIATRDFDRPGALSFANGDSERAGGVEFPGAHGSSNMFSSSAGSDRDRLCIRPVVCLVTNCAATSPGFIRELGMEDAVETDEACPLGQYVVCWVEAEEG